MQVNFRKPWFCEGFRIQRAGTHYVPDRFLDRLPKTATVITSTPPSPPREAGKVDPKSSGKGGKQAQPKGGKRTGPYGSQKTPAQKVQAKRAQAAAEGQKAEEDAPKGEQEDPFEDV